jgi:hypothetical protein
MALSISDLGGIFSAYALPIRKNTMIKYLISLVPILASQQSLFQHLPSSLNPCACQQSHELSVKVA